MSTFDDVADDRAVAVLVAWRPNADLAAADLDRVLTLVLDRPPAAPRQRLPVAGTVLVVGLGATAVLAATRGRPFPSDFLTYRYAAALAAAGGDAYGDVVRGAGLESGQPFTYPPIATVVLWPSTLGPWPVGWTVWCVASVLVLGAVLNCAVPADTARRPVVVGAALAASAATGIVAVNVTMGQVNLVLMGLCVADVVRRADSPLGRWLPPGFLVGLAAAVKLTPALFVLHFVLTGQGRRAGWAVTSFATATAIGVVLRPEMSRTFFVHTIWTLDERVALGHPTGFAGNVSITGTLDAAGLPGLARPATALGALAAVLVAARVHRMGRALDGALVLGTAVPLLSPWSWNHHHVFLLPALTVLALRDRTRGPALALAAAVIGLRFCPGQVSRAGLVLTAIVVVGLLGARVTARRREDAS